MTASSVTSPQGRPLWAPAAALLLGLAHIPPASHPPPPRPQARGTWPHSRRDGYLAHSHPLLSPKVTLPGTVLEGWQQGASAGSVPQHAGPRAHNLPDERSGRPTPHGHALLQALSMCRCAGRPAAPLLARLGAQTSCRAGRDPPGSDTDSPVLDDRPGFPHLTTPPITSQRARAWERGCAGPRESRPPGHQLSVGSESWSSSQGQRWRSVPSAPPLTSILRSGIQCLPLLTAPAWSGQAGSAAVTSEPQSHSLMGGQQGGRARWSSGDQAGGMDCFIHPLPRGACAQIALWAAKPW